MTAPPAPSPQQLPDQLLQHQDLENAQQQLQPVQQAPPQLPQPNKPPYQQAVQPVSQEGKQPVSAPQDFPQHPQASQTQYVVEPQPQYAPQPGYPQDQQYNATTYQTQGAPSGPQQRPVGVVNISLPQQPAAENLGYAKPEADEDCSGQAGYFFLGFILALILDVFVFLFFCCAESVGITRRRKAPFLIGSILGFIISGIIWAVVIFVVIRDSDFN